MAKNVEKKKKPKIIKQLKNGSALYDNGMVRSPPATLAFVWVSKPKPPDTDGKFAKKAGEEGAEGKYQVTPLFKKGEDLSLLELACKKFAIAEKGEKGAMRFRRDGKFAPLRKQDEKVGDYEGFVKGAYFMGNSSKYKPRVTNFDKSEIEHSAFYSGCRGRVVCNPYIYDVTGNRGVGLGLNAVQFLGNGKRFGGAGVDPDDVFDESEEENLEGYEDDVDDSSDDDDDDNEFV
jgi:hypothetical protein